MHLSLVEMCADLPLVSVAAGDVVIEHGRPPGELLILVDGEVNIEHDGSPFAWINSSGSILGEMSSLLDRPATATVRAVVDSTFLVAADGKEFLAARPDVTLAVARTLAIRLDNLSGYLTDVKRQFADQSDHFGMLDDVLNTLVHHQAPEPRSGSQRMPELDY